MGAQVAVGPLIYTAIEAEWRAQLDGATGPRTPKHRFLLMNVSVTNSGGSDVGIPLLRVIDTEGREFMEEDNGDGVPHWLGFLRVVRPAQTEQGQLLFDVPPGSLKLRVSVATESENEPYSLIDVPFRPDHAVPMQSTLPAPMEEKK